MNTFDPEQLHRITQDMTVRVGEAFTHILAHHNSNKTAQYVLPAGYAALVLTFLSGYIVMRKEMPELADEMREHLVHIAQVMYQVVASASPEITYETLIGKLPEGWDQ